MDEDGGMCESCGGCGPAGLPRRQSLSLAKRASAASGKATAKGESAARVIANIRTSGGQYDAQTLRSSVIGGLEIRTKRGHAENMIHIGCACLGTALPLRAYCLILQKLGVEYAFLDKEYCCGAPLVGRALAEGRDPEEADEAITEFLGLNVAQARAIGSKRMVYFCQWCAYLGKRFYSDSDIEQVYAPDVLVQHLETSSLKLEAKVAYFGNSPHRRPLYVPEQNFDLSWAHYKTLVRQIEGLEVVNIPSYCCQLNPEVIFERTAKSGVDILVTTCMACYGNLSRKSKKLAPQIRVKHLYSLLLAAMENDPRILSWF